MVDRYLASLFSNPQHPAPWTNINNRDELIQKESPEVTGFKLMYNTLERHSALQSWIHEEKDLKFIHLTRDNLLKCFISGERMRQSKVAHTKDKDFKYSAVKININKMQVYFNSTYDHQNHYRNLFSASHPFLELSYENLFTDKEASIAKILNFLSLPKEDMPLPSIKKISSRKLKDEVANPQQLINALSGTRHEKYLADFEC